MSLSRMQLTVALAGVLSLGSSLQAQQGKGYTYDFVQKTQSTNPMMPAAPSGDSISMRAKVQVDAAGHSRMEVVQAAQNPIWSVGDYALFNGTAMIIVSPSRKEYMEMGTDFGMGEINEMMKNMGTTMKMTEGKFAFDTLPESETLMGRPTRHYRMTRDGTIEMGTPGGAMSMTMTSETNYYVVRERVPAVNPLAGQSAMSAGPGSMMSPEVTEKIRAAAAAMNGFVVRMVSHSTTGIMGMTVDATQSMEVENLAEAPVAPISATPPAGYAKVTMTSRMKGMTGG